MIKYKAIDSSTDMIVATSGSTRITFTRIISSTISPYSIDTSMSKTFKDSITSH